MRALVLAALALGCTAPQAAQRALPQVSAGPEPVVLAPLNWGGPDSFILLAKIPAASDTTSKPDRVCFVIQPTAQELCNTAPWPTPGGVMSLGDGASRVFFTLTPKVDEAAGVFANLPAGKRYEITAYAQTGDLKGPVSDQVYVLDRIVPPPPPPVPPPPPAPKPPGKPELLKAVERVQASLDELRATVERIPD